MDYTQLGGWLLAIALMLAGLAGNLLPLIPAAPLLLAGFVLGAWIDGFERVGWGWLALLTALAVIMQVIDFVSGAWGAKKMGASRQAVIGATLGAILGLFFGIPGLVFGPFVGAALGELLARGDLAHAGRVGVAAWLGMAVGTVAKLALSIMMIGLFAFAYFV
ncbi:DUF456 domain-containing protein [Chitinimonas koreensis]|uniref:DUF456 domain-containing protein n=1 Tax=Chitinimonas koreensis TaxID=356302 RepID=UPI000408A3C3|nr:DUF456 domain-containing protein [Chitinimonas koreensis]QNM97400.1 DUF456 domain-containing protein [Chitinimonas koreensis]